MKFIKRVFLYGFLVLAFLFAGGVVLLHRTIELDKIKPQLEKAFTEFLQRDLTIDHLGWRFFPMPTLVGYDAQLWEDEKTLMARCPEVEITISFRSLWNKQLQFGNLNFVHPKGTLRRRKDGSFPLAQMIQEIINRLRRIRREQGIKKLPYEFKKIRIEEGFIELFDLTKQKEPLQTTLLVNSEGEIQGKPGARRFPFTWESKVKNTKEEGLISIRGILKKYSKVNIFSNAMPISLLVEFGPTAKNWDGQVSFDVDLERKISGLDWSVKGESQNLRPRAKGVVPTLRATFDLNRSQPSVLDIFLEESRTDAQIHLTVQDFQNRVLQGTFTAKQVDVEEIVKWTENVRPLVSSATAQVDFAELSSKTFWEIDMKVNISTAIFRQMKLNQVELAFHRTSSGTVRLSGIQAYGLGGSLNGEFELEETQTITGGPTFVTNWTLRHMAVSPILRSFKSKQMLSGIADSQGELKGYFRQMGWPNMKGQIDLEIKNGFLWETPGLLKSFSRLNVKSLLKGMEGKGEKGFSFQTAKIQINLKEGKAILDPPGVFESESVHIGFMGFADLNEKKVNGKIVFQFLTVVGDVLRVVPGVKQILYGKTKGLVPIWLSVKGPWENPSVSLLPVESISKSLWNGIGRVLRFPFKPFEKKK